MKRILVIDESEVVRETLALILGREFVVVNRPQAVGSLSFSGSESEVDLLILGLTPTMGMESSALLRFAMQAPFAVLFLVDSKSAAKTIEDREKVGCLAKPFNPYELKEKVGRLLARQSLLANKFDPADRTPNQDLPDFLTFPYLSRAAASVIGRFATAGLPLLISGEVGCGQDRVARAVHSVDRDAGSLVVLNAAELNRDFLAEKSAEISYRRRFVGTKATLLVENIDKIMPAAGPALLNFLDSEQKFAQWRLLATAGADLLEKVYQGNFLETLYYRFATLTLRLSPLRERREDIPAIADWLARFYGKTIGVDQVTLSNSAKERLKNYLWFGNLHEMETVLARTLALRRKPHVDAADLIFDWAGDIEPSESPEFDEFVPPASRAKADLKLVPPQPAPQNGLSASSGSENGRSRSPDLHVLIHELAHELKNPMVTIKTFAQLLNDRYQDENFRARFQDVVGSDIERMDDLLEIMIEFGDFSQPQMTQVLLEIKLRSALSDIHNEVTKRQIRLQWKGNHSQEILTDEAQLKYVLKNVLLAVLCQAKTGSEIELDVEKQGCVAISYAREGARVPSFKQYLAAATAKPDESTLPLRILLAKQLVERNGGRMAVDSFDSEREILRMEFPIA